MLVLWLILAVLLVMSGLFSPIISFFGLLIAAVILVVWIGIGGFILLLFFLLVASIWLKSKGY